jgi:hypothetical protein
VDELILAPNIIPAHASSLPLPDHVHRLVPLNRSPFRLELLESLLGIHSPFDGSVVLLDDVIQDCTAGAGNDGGESLPS